MRDDRNQPATIKLFLVEGKPTGLRTAEISNWTGKAIAAPRVDMKDLLRREELANPGIYFLAGTDPVSGEDSLYIGEAESVASRLPHHTKKDFWVSVVAFVSKDENLTKAHIRYLEGKLIELAPTLRIRLMNSTTSGARLPESDEAEMDVFLDKVLQLLPVLGISHFNKKQRFRDEKPDLLYCTIKGLVAKGNRTESGFVVYEGSQAVQEHRPSAKSIRNHRERLLGNGLLKERADHLLFTEDCEFSSPSLAGSVVRGGNTNGLEQWRNKQGKKLKDLESENS